MHYIGIETRIFSQLLQDGLEPVHPDAPEERRQALKDEVLNTPHMHEYFWTKLLASPKLHVMSVRLIETVVSRFSALHNHYDPKLSARMCRTSDRFLLAHLP